MPQIEVNGVSLHYVEAGQGPETIVFSHGLLMNHEMFAEQVAHLSARYRCIAYDHRGQGRSEVTETGYDMDTLASDAAALIEALDAAPCHFAGLSMGGFVGMRLAARRPGLIRSLILLDTSADPEPQENGPKYRALNFVGRWIGLWAVVGRVMPIMFGKSFLSDPARAEERAHWRRAIAGGDRKGISRAVRGVIEREGMAAELVRIGCPVLVCVGEEDVATVPEKAERIAAAIPGADLVRIPRAGHSATVENPQAVNAAMDAFLSRLG